MAKKDKFKTIKYSGQNRSFTIGNYKFLRGEIKSIESELADIALKHTCFEEIIENENNENEEEKLL